MGGFANDVSRAEALLRVADALLQALGTSELILVLPVPTQNSADPSTELSTSLGLASPAVEHLSLSPAVVRNIGGSTVPRTRLEVMLSASTVKAEAESRNFDPPQSLFDAALGILYGEKLLRIESVGWELFAGAPYLYRMVLTD